MGALRPAVPAALVLDLVPRIPETHAAALGVECTFLDWQKMSHDRRGGGGDPASVMEIFA